MVAEEKSDGMGGTGSRKESPFPPALPRWASSGDLVGSPRRTSGEESKGVLYPPAPPLASEATSSELVSNAEEVTSPVVAESNISPEAARSAGRQASMENPSWKSLEERMCPLSGRRKPPPPPPPPPAAPYAEQAAPSSERVEASR